jgi:diguanylate cyclase (GGDEF)-like protein
MSDFRDGPDLDDLVRLSVFSSIGKSIVAENGIRGVLDRVMEHVGAFFGPLNWSILLVDAGHDELVFTVVAGKASEALTGRKVKVGEGIAGWVARYGKPAIVAVAHSDPRFSPKYDEILGFHTESVVAVPLLAGGRIFGVIELLNRLDGRTFSAFDMRVLSTIADFAAIAIEKSYYLSEAQRLAELDHLTGLLNRRGLGKVLEREGARLRRYPGNVSVIAADVDGFKMINDRHGHQAGDEVLKAVAECLKTSVRSADSVARYGGDEFVVVMPNTGPEDAEIARARLQAALDRAGKEAPVPWSITLGAHSSNKADFGELFRESDRDLYRRKAGPIEIAENLLAALDDETQRP